MSKVTLGLVYQATPKPTRLDWVAVNTTSQERLEPSIKGHKNGSKEHSKNTHSTQKGLGNNNNNTATSRDSQESNQDTNEIKDTMSQTMAQK